MVNTALILAGGLGKRLLPITAAIPKEMLPVVDRPLLQFAAEEAVASGIRRIVFVTSPGKGIIRDYFSGRGSAIARLQAAGDDESLAIATGASRLADFEFVEQPRPLGIANAVACARQWLDEPAFALMFPDDLLFAKVPPLQQLIARHRTTGGGVIAVQSVPADEVANYGIVSINPASGGRLAGIVEKPEPAEAPSNLAVIGRYVLTRGILDHIDRLQPGRGGEYQLTDAIESQLQAGDPVHAVEIEAERFDTGRPGGYLVALTAAALRRPDLGDALATIRRMLAQGAPTP